MFLLLPHINRRCQGRVIHVFAQPLAQILMLLYELLGYGNITKYSCGRVKHVDKCPAYGTRSIVKFSYHNYQCPICYKSTAGRVGDRVHERITKVGGLLRRFAVKTGLVHHFVIFVSDDLQHLPRQELQGKYVIKYSKMIGIVGGVIAFHHLLFRVY